MVVAAAQNRFVHVVMALAPLTGLPIGRRWPVPRPPAAERRLPAWQWAGEAFKLHRPTVSLRRVHPVASFVCAGARHHPLARTRRSHCLAGTTPRPRPLEPRDWGPGSAWSYWRHSHQSAAFEAPADSQAGTGYHSGRHTPCAVSLTLRRRRHVGRTPGRPDRSGMCEAPAPPQFPAPRVGR